MKKLYSALLMCLGLSLPLFSQTADEIVDRIQQKYENLNNFSAQFTQIMVSKAFSRQEIEKGIVYLKRPGKMRWEYKEPEKKLMVSDGKTIYWYLIEDKQVQIMNLEEWKSEQTPILYLSGRGKLKEDFDIEKLELMKPLDEGNIQLKLVPLHQESDFQSIMLEINPTRNIVRRMMIVDLLENITDYIFEDIKENQTLSDELFTFTIPPGVEVYTTEGKKIKEKAK
jgi:outer membrane lipoprotein carrier protein